MHFAVANVTAQTLRAGGQRTKLSSGLRATSGVCSYFRLWALRSLLTDFWTLLHTAGAWLICFLRATAIACIHSQAPGGIEGNKRFLYMQLDFGDYTIPKMFTLLCLQSNLLRLATPRMLSGAQLACDNSRQEKSVAAANAAVLVNQLYSKINSLHQFYSVMVRMLTS